jgi:hypothetical protein
MNAGCQGPNSQGSIISFASNRGAIDMVEVCRTEVIPLESLSSNRNPVQPVRFRKVLTLFSPLQSNIDSDLQHVRFSLYHNGDERELLLTSNEFIGSALWPQFQILSLAEGEDRASRTLSSQFVVPSTQKLRGTMSIRFLQVCLESSTRCFHVLSVQSKFAVSYCFLVSSPQSMGFSLIFVSDSSCLRIL